MFTEKMQKALNDQVNAELFSFYIYLSMAAYFEDQNFKGFAHWMRVQAGEEMIHAMKFYDYIVGRREPVELQAIAKPQVAWASPLAAFEEAFKHEQYITGRIHDLVNLAREESDPATETFLQWFVNEQVEEESSVDAVVQDLRRVADFPAGLFMIDRELAGRTAAPAGGDAT